MATKDLSSAREFARHSIDLYLTNNMYDHAKRIALLTQDKDLIEWVEAKKKAYEMDQRMKPSHKSGLSIDQLTVDSDDDDINSLE